MTAFPCDTKFCNYSSKIVHMRVIFGWSVIYRSSWSGLIKAGAVWRLLWDGSSSVILVYLNLHVAQIPQCIRKHPTMHHFVTKMCTCVHISVTKWCIVGYGLVHCGICEMGLLSLSDGGKLIMCGWGWEWGVGVGVGDWGMGWGDWGVGGMGGDGTSQTGSHVGITNLVLVRLRRFQSNFKFFIMLN